MKRDTHIELGREESNQVLPEINMILGGTSTRGNGGNGKKNIWSKSLPTTHLLNAWHEPILFTLEDGEGVTFSHENSPVISIVSRLTNHRVYMILVDDCGVINILSNDVMTQTRIDPSRLILVKTPLIRIVGTSMQVNGALDIIVIIGTYSKYLTLQQTFMINDTSLAYNVILTLDA